MIKSFVRVEAISRRVLRKGIEWKWTSTAEYLSTLERDWDQCRRADRPYRGTPLRHGRRRGGAPGDGGRNSE